MSEKREISTKVLRVILSKAWSDPAFKAKLFVDANNALRGLGIKVPAGVNVKFVEDTPTTWHFVVPAPSAEGELTDELLEVAGGQTVAGMLPIHKK